MSDARATAAAEVRSGAADVVSGLHGLRIALVGPSPPPSGGMANQTEQLHRLLAAEGADVEWIVTNAVYRPGWVAHVRGVRALFRLVPYVARAWRTTRGIDVLHVMANSGWSWFLFAVPVIVTGRLRGVPVVVNYRGGHAESFLDRFGWCARPFIKLATELVVPSRYLEGVFSRHGLAAHVVSNIVDVDRFCFRAPSSQTPREPHLVSIRNLETIYGNDIVLSAFARLREHFPKARLTIAGEGPEESRLVELAHELDLKESVDFPGRLNRAQMAELLGSADVVLNASRVDNMPNSILEALAAGVPVVTTNAGGIPMIVEHERTALVCPIDDAPALSEQVRRVLENRSLAAAISNAGREEAERYSWPQVREEWTNVYARVRTGSAK